MIDWPVATLGSIISVTDFVANGSFESLRLNVTYSSSPEFAILVRLVDHNNRWSGPLKYVNESAYNFLSKSVVSTGDIVVANVGANAGTVFRAPDLGRPMTLGPNSILCRSRNLLEYDRDYMYQFLSSPMGQSLIETIVSGSAQPKFNKTGFRQLLIPVPPISEQRAIAEVLGALDDKIAANTKLVQTSDVLAGVLTRQALDFDNRVALASVAQVTMGSSPFGATLNEVGDGEVFYQGVRDFGVRFPANRVWTTGPVRFAETLDTLLSVRAPVGRANLAQERTCIGRGIASIRSLEAHPYSIFHRLRDDPEMWAPYEAEGTVFGSINRGQLDTLAMPAIFADDRDRLEAQLAAIELRVASALAENRTLAETRDVLLPQLMSGKLRVRDAEKAVEAVV